MVNCLNKTDKSHLVIFVQSSPLTNIVQSVPIISRKPSNFKDKD